MPPSSQTAGQASSSKKDRLLPNPANTWQQQPRIKSPAARARAYLIDAGLYDRKGDGKLKKKHGRAEHDLLDPHLDLDSPEVKFGRLLGGTDQRARHSAVTKLRAYLKARCDIRNEKGGISELDLMKLWKGLWHTLYMADRVPVQDELSKRLAELMWCLGGTEEEDEYAAQVYLDMDEEHDEGEISEEHKGSDDIHLDDEFDDEDVTMEELENTLGRFEGNSDGSGGAESSDQEGSEENEEPLDENGQDEEESDEDEHDSALDKHCRGAHLVALYIRTFFRTVRREWGNMDKHRVDKFYTAIRLMISEVYKYMAKRHWNLGIIRLFNDALFEEALAHTPNGLRYHLVDITLDELTKVNNKAPIPLTEATFLDCLEPYFAMVQTVNDKIVHKRVMDNILEKFLEEYSFVSDAALSGEGEERTSKLILDQVHVGSVAQFVFELASDAETADRYRKSLYDMHKHYMRRIKKAGRDVELDVGEDDEELDGGLGADDENEAADGNAAETADKSGNSDVKPKKKRSKKKGQADDDQPIGSKEKDTPSSANMEKVAKEYDEEIEAAVDNDKDASVSKKKSKKDKKKKKKASRESAKSAEDIGTSALSTPEQGKLEAPSSKKKSKKKKRKDSTKTDDGDELITISVKEQKEAAKAVNEVTTPTNQTFGTMKKRRSPPSVDPHKMADSDGVMSDIETPGAGGPTRSAKRRKSTTESDKKRVSFGRVNHSKSYKASMKALKTMDQPSTAARTPDGSILRKKVASEKSGRMSSKKAKQGKGSSRKRAIDYF